MTDLIRRQLKDREIKNTVQVFSAYIGETRVGLRMEPANSMYAPLSVQLTPEEVDDLIVMLEYYKREALKNDAA